MTLYEIILRVHVVCGFAALVGGLIPMLTQKGSEIHKKSGWIYFWAMFGVFATSTAMFALKTSLLFLFLIGVFSFYNTLSGVRLLKYKNPNSNISKFDWSVASFVFCAGLIMIGLGIYSIVMRDYNFAILYIIFGAICTSIANNDLCFLNRVASRQELAKNEWLYRHINRICASYIATLTAFIITIQVFPPLVAWLAPGIIGGMIISVVVKKFKNEGEAVVN